MAFDELTLGQQKLILELLEEVSSGKYSSEFYADSTFGKGWFIQLEGISDNEDKELSGFTESDLIALSINKYLTLITKQSGLTASLTQKAFEQYHLSQAALQLANLAQPSHTDMQNSKENNIDIFISHSSKDKTIAESLINLLRAALNVPANKIRCTSVDGYRLPAGASTDEQLRQEIYQARVFLGLITPTSFQSTYVLFELGARWGARLHLSPVLAAGADANTLRAPLSSLNALSCDEPAQIYQLVDNIASTLKVTAGSPSSYQQYVNTLVGVSKAAKEKTQSRAALDIDTSIFTVAEEKDFQHIQKMLNKNFRVVFGVSQQKADEKLSTKIRAEAYETNLLTAIIDFVNKGYNYLDYADLEIEISKPFDEEHNLASSPDVTLRYGRATIYEDIAKELQKYGLARYIRIQRFDRSEGVYEFTEKMHRFNYWLEFRGYSFKKISFEFAEHLES